MPNNYTINVDQTGAGKTKDEIVSLLRDVKKEASDASKELAKLRAESIGAREASAAHGRVLADLRTRLANGNQQLKEVNSQMSFFKKEAADAERAVASYERQIDKNSKTLIKLAENGKGQSDQAKALITENQKLGQAINATNETLNKHNESIKTLTTQQDTLRTGQKLTVQGLINEKQVHEQLTSSQNTLNTSKQRYQQTVSDLEGKIRGYKQQLTQLDSQHRATQREQDKLTAGSIALANAVGNAAYNAFRSFLSQGKDFIVDTAIYAARTDEMRIAMLNMGKESGHSRGELLNQEEAIRRLNITTQEARETLTKFQLAQLDVSKASALARAAQDLAVVAGVETGEELNRLTHGITTLQIRVLRTAGVFVSLEGAMKDAAIAQGRSTESFSEAEKQTILLNKVLEVGARATGNYESSLDNAGKRMRSMTRIFQDMQNQLGGLIQGPFGNLVDTLSGIMTLITKFPIVFAAATAAVIAFGIELLRTLAASGGYTAQIFKMAGGLWEATRATVGLSTATKELAATEEAEAVAGGASSATRLDRLKSVGTALGGILATATKMVGVFYLVNVALSVIAETSKRLGGTTKYSDLLDSKNIEEQRKGLQGLQQQYNELTTAVQRYQAQGIANEQGNSVGVRGYLANIANDNLPSAFTRLFAYDTQLPEDLKRQLQETADEIGKVTDKMAEQGDQFGINNALNREYADALSKAGKANLDFSNIQEILDVRLDRFATQLDGLQQPMEALEGRTLNLNEALSVLSPELLAIDNAIKKTSGSFEEYQERWEDTVAAVNAIRVANGRGELSLEGIAAAVALARVETERGAKTWDGYGDATARAQKRLEDVRQRLQSMRREIRGLFGEGSPDEVVAGGLELEEKRLQIVRQEIDSINDARINLNRDVGQKIPEDRETRSNLQHTYENTLKVRDAIRASQKANKDFVADVVVAQQLAANARTTVVSAELTAAKLIADNQYKRLQGERQLTAEIIAMSKDREERAKDEAGTAREAFQSLYKEQLTDLIDFENAQRKFHARVALAQGQNIGSFRIPQFNAINTKLDNIAVAAAPAVSQAENVAKLVDKASSIDANVATLVVNSVPAVTVTEEQYRAHPNLPWSKEVVDKYAPKLAEEELKKNYLEHPNLPWSLDVVKKYGGGAAATPTQATTAAAAAVNTAGKTLQGMMEFIQSQGFRVGSTTGGLHNKGSYHPLGKAADVHLDNHTTEQINALIEAGRSAGYTVFDERTRPKGQAVWGGPHIHFQIGGGRRRVGGSSAESIVEALPTSPRLPNSFREGTPVIVRPPDQQQQVAGYRATLTEARRDRATALSGFGDVTQIKEYYKQVDALERNDFETREQNITQLNVLDAEYNAKYFEGQQHREAVTTTAELARKKAALATFDVLTALVAEETSKWRDSALYKRQLVEASEIRIREAYNASSDNLAAALEDQKRRQENYQKYLDTLHNNTDTARIRASQESEDRYNQMIEETNTHWRNSLQFRLNQWRDLEVSRYEESKKAEDNIADLRSQVAHATDLDPQKAEIARLQAILEVRQADGEARASMEANAVKLADAQIYHADRANAKVLDYLAKQRSADDIVADARIATMDKIFGAIDSGLGKITSKLGFFGDIVKELISGFARLALSKVFTTLFGLGPTTQQTRGGGGGGIAGLLGGFGGIAQRVLGIGGGGGFPATPPFAGGNVIGGGAIGPQASIGNYLAGVGGSGLGAAVSQIPIAQIAQRAGVIDLGGGSIYNPAATGTRSRSVGGGGLLSGLGQSFSGVAPLLPFIGAGAGAQLGGGGLGSVLGAAGGGIAGLLGIALAPTSIGGLGGAAGLISGTVGLTALGVAAGFAAPALIAAAIIIGKNKKRRAAETQRNAFTTDALGQLNNLLSQVRRDKISGDDALGQAASIREQYLASSQALSDKKTREIALKDVSRLDGIISQIKIAAVGQERRQQLDSQLVPEFARGGVVPGVDLGYDSVVARVRPGEVVLTRQQQAMVGYNNLAKANIPTGYRTSFDSGGYVSSSRGNGFGYGRDMNIYLVTDKRFAESMAVEGQDRIVELAANDIRNGGKIRTSIKRIQ